MSSSQNGWSVDATGGQQDHSAVAGVTFPNGVRKGDVATVLFYVATRFHREVEPLKKGACWGWFNRPVRGATSISNHASGTAIDLNAEDHPLGVAGTFNAAKRAAIGRILDDCDGVVRWGGDYSGRKDEMHFEINRGLAAVSALATRIRSQQEDLPVDQATFNKLMTNWAKSAEGIGALAGVWSSAWGSGTTRETAGDRLAHVDAAVDQIQTTLAEIAPPKPATHTGT